MPHYALPHEIMYHTGLSREMTEGARYALVPGDPGRVEGLAKALDEKASFVCSHRDFTTWKARVSGETVLVMSTGMGGPCVTFAVEELARLGVTSFIRVGTTGSIQDDLNLGDLVINKGAVRRDGASRAYAPLAYPAMADMRITLALEEAARELKVPCKTGISISTDSFWPGQERYDSFSGYVRKICRGASPSTGPWAVRILKWRMPPFSLSPQCWAFRPVPSAAWWPSGRTAKPWRRRQCMSWRKKDSIRW